jgi:hypothetical protein
VVRLRVRLDQFLLLSVRVEVAVVAMLLLWRALPLVLQGLAANSI